MISGCWDSRLVRLVLVVGSKPEYPDMPSRCTGCRACTVERRDTASINKSYDRDLIDMGVAEQEHVDDDRACRLVRTALISSNYTLSEDSNML